MEKSDILKINKGGDIVSMTPYAQTHIRRMVLLFIFILPTFLCYHIHLTRRADMEINLAEYGRKEINIAYI